MVEYSPLSRGTTEATARPVSDSLREAVEPEQSVEQRGDLVAGLADIGGEAPARGQIPTGEQPYRSLRVANIDG